MGEQTQIGVKVDKELKDEVDAILRGLGIKPTAAINGLYQYILRHRELPFIINMQVNRISTLSSHLFMDFTLLKTTLEAFYRKVEERKPIKDSELDFLKNVIREFNANFRQVEKVLYQRDDGCHVDWKRVFNGAKRAFYVIEAELKYTNGQGYYLEYGGIIKLSLALKMIIDAESNL